MNEHGGEEPLRIIPIQMNSVDIGKSANPTLRENIEQKIQYHRDEIARLERVREKLPALLDVNLRDLREAMNY